MKAFRKKNVSFYSLFPVISVAFLFLATIFERNYPYRNPVRIVEYAYLNILYQGALFFLIAYVIPLIVSLSFAKQTRRLLKISSVVFILVYLLISLYFFYLKSDSSSWINGFDFVLATIGGVLLGITQASSNNKIAEIQTEKIMNI